MGIVIFRCPFCGRWTGTNEKDFHSNAKCDHCGKSIEREVKKAENES